jgi:ribosomal protein L11
LGTVLGNLGINAVKFCKEFNEITADLPNYLKLSVIINYYENNSYDIFVKEPCIGYIIGLLKAPIDVEADINTSLCYIELDEVIQLALFK